MHGVHAKMRLHPVSMATQFRYVEAVEVKRICTFGNVSPASMSSSTGCHEDAFENIDERENSFDVELYRLS
jgi:hypothetical protein